jgi:hypothetical protein
MFRKVLASITRSFSSSKSAQDKLPRRVSEGSVLEKVAKGGVMAPGGGVAGVRPGGQATAEALCGIDPRMSKTDISARLKLLYRRYNRAASSLDATMRAEADKMLDAIVEVREKHFGPI